MCLLIFLILLIIISGERHWVRGSARGEYHAKEIVDSLTKVQRDKYKYDPYVIEDKIYTWLRIPFIAQVEHYETFVEGLKTFHKAETCETIEKDGQLFVNARLGAGPLHFNTVAFAELADIEQIVTIKASLNYCKFIVNFSVDPETGRNRRFQSLGIDDFSGVKVCITGFGCLSWLLSKIITLMMKLNHGIIRNLAEFWIERYVSRFFPRIQLPTEGENINNASISENYGALDNVDESLQETSMSRIQQFMPENASNVWYSNVPLLEGNVVIRSHNDSESDADDVQVEFTFLKCDVNLEDVEPLTRADMATCCVFFKSDTEFLKTSATKDTEKHLPFKHSKDFLKGFLTTYEASDIGGISMLLEELEKSCASDERTRSCNERLMKTFIKDYPNFVSLTYMCEERKQEADGSNEDIDSSAEAKICESQSKVTVEPNHVIEVNVATAGSQNELNREFGDSNELSETADQSIVLKSSTRNAFQCAPLPIDSTTDHIGNETSATSNEESLKRLTDLCNAAQPHLQRMQDSKKIDIEQNAESILKWIPNSANIDKSDCIGSRKSRYQSNEVPELSFQNDFAQVIPDKPLKNINIRNERSKNKTLKDYNCTSIEQLNAIEDAIRKCFENPWMEIPPQGDFFFTDSESNTISDLSKSQKFELAEQLHLLADIKMEELLKETDHFDINLDSILKEADAKAYGKPNKYSRTTELNTPFQSETANSEVSDISKIVKNFFEQNSIVKILNEQKKTIHPNLGAVNKSINESSQLTLGENDINISVSPNVNYSNVITAQPSNLIKESLEQSFASLELRKFDLSSKYSNNRTAMISDVGTQSTHNTMTDEVRVDEFDSDEWSDETCDSSFSSYTDINLCRSTDIHPDFLENAQEIDFLNNNKTDAINRQSTGVSIYSSSDENLQASGNSSPKTSTIKILDICKSSPSVNEKRVVEIEKLVAKVPEANQTAPSEEQIVSINETNIHTNVEKNELSDSELAKILEPYVKYTLMMDLDSEKLYDNFMNYEETKSNVVINVEDDITQDLYDDTVKQNKDYANITEMLKKLLEVSSNEQLIVETSDTFPTIQDEEFEDITEQTNLLKLMFKEFVHQQEADSNSFEEANDQKPYSKNLNKQSVFKNEKVNDKIPSILDKGPLERQNFCGPISSLQSTEDLWRESVIVDANGNVSWKKALQIWGCGKGNRLTLS